MYRYVYDSDGDLLSGVLLVGVAVVIALILFLIKWGLVKSGIKTRHEMKDYIDDGMEELGYGFSIFIPFFLASLFVMMIAGVVMKLMGVNTSEELHGVYPYVWVLVGLSVAYWLLFLLRSVFNFLKFLTTKTKN